MCSIGMLCRKQISSPVTDHCSESEHHQYAVVVVVVVVVVATYTREEAGAQSERTNKRSVDLLRHSLVIVQSIANVEAGFEIYRHLSLVKFACLQEALPMY